MSVDIGELWVGKPFQAPVEPIVHGPLALFLGATGLALAGVYSVQKKTNVAKELGIAAVSSVMLGFAVFLSFLAFGLYV
ncbi:hypothetical protein H4219_005161 [Mycoemilia scoparia]|uniref:Dolichyl-diphosphooligosaccharide-protein glycosyltransferase subunit OST5 n=1 Tax=Mycoemilia scoparia TaxID=417184 RepID=A0A9W7ZYN8_9FUNG|nr:hypothetical protein H4219_005161 [Mycoemilia scoparia]